MIILLKIISVVIFILSGGILGKTYNSHKFLAIFAGIVTILGSIYLSKDICEDLGYCDKGSFLSFFSSNLFRDELKDSSKGPEMVWIATGSFKMGANNGFSNEKPVHKVFLNKFAIGRYEVTFAEYDKFAKATDRTKPEDEGWGRGNNPVINVSWYDAVAYAKWLSQQTGQSYRLPTEAEWEYAARAGTNTKYWWGNDVGINNANCNDCGSEWYDKQPIPVGSFKENSFRIYDTVGNVWEWVHDIYHSNYYSISPSINPKGPSEGQYRTQRGGSWLDDARSSRAANRDSNSPEYSDNNIGFRLLRQP
jgi:formylglycine-generating enzyme required for sulfatase activity